MDLRERLLPTRRDREPHQGTPSRARNGPHQLLAVLGQPVPRPDDRGGLRHSCRDPGPRRPDLLRPGSGQHLRDRLLKIGARVAESVRRIVVHLPASFPSSRIGVALLRVSEPKTARPVRARSSTPLTVDQVSAGGLPTSRSSSLFARLPRPQAPHVRGPACRQPAPPALLQWRRTRSNRRLASRIIRARGPRDQAPSPWRPTPCARAGSPRNRGRRRRSPATLPARVRDESRAVSSPAIRSSGGRRVRGVPC